MQIRTPLVAGVVGALALMFSPTASTAPAQAQTEAKTGTIPVEVWSLASVVSSVQVSPDGKKILVLKRESREGENILEIYNTDDLLAGNSQPVRRLNADPMEIVSASWATDNHIFGTAWQVNRTRVRRPEDDVRDYTTYAYNLEGNEFNQITGSFQIVELLPDEPNTVLISSGRAVSDGQGVDPFQAFRPRAYYRFNLDTGSRSLVIKGSEKYPQITFDNKGNPRTSSSVDPSTNEVVSYYRLPGENSWKEFGARYDLDEEDNLYRVLSGFIGVAGFDPERPEIGYIIENFNQQDKAALWEYNFATNSLGKKLFESETSDVMNIRLHSLPGNDKLVGAMYPDWRMETHWFDEEEKALYGALEQQIPFAHQVSISSRSRDGKRMIVTNNGPRDPGSFWLITELEWPNWAAAIR